MLVRLSEIRSLWSKVWQNGQHYFISAMSAIKGFGISVCCHKKPMRNTKAPTPARFDPFDDVVNRSFSRDFTRFRKR